MRKSGLIFKDDDGWIVVWGLNKTDENKKHIRRVLFKGRCFGCLKFLKMLLGVGQVPSGGWEWSLVIDPGGVLSDKYESRVIYIYDARSRIDAKLSSSVIRGRDWDWLSARSYRLVDIQSKLPSCENGGY